jgi:hypothetical protein
MKFKMFRTFKRITTFTSFSPLLIVFSMVRINSRLVLFFPATWHKSALHIRPSGYICMKQSETNTFSIILSTYQTCQSIWHVNFFFLQKIFPLKSFLFKQRISLSSHSLYCFQDYWKEKKNRKEKNIHKIQTKYKIMCLTYTKHN